MVAVASLTAAQRRELQPRMREQELFEYTLREQVQSSRELLFVVQEEVRRSERLREEVGQELERTRARVADELHHVALQTTLMQGAEGSMTRQAVFDSCRKNFASRERK